MMSDDAGRLKKAARTDAEAMFASLRLYRFLRYVGCRDASSGCDARPGLGSGYDLLCRAVVQIGSSEAEIASEATVDAREDREACRRELKVCAERLVRNPYSQLIVIWSMDEEPRVEVVRGGGVPADRPVAESIRWLAFQWRFEFQMSFGFFFDDASIDDRE